jgi:hypothetical protein
VPLVRAPAQQGLPSRLSDPCRPLGTPGDVGAFPASIVGGGDTGGTGGAGDGTGGTGDGTGGRKLLQTEGGNATAAAEAGVPSPSPAENVTAPAADPATPSPSASPSPTPSPADSSPSPSPSPSASPAPGPGTAAASTPGPEPGGAVLPLSILAAASTYVESFFQSPGGLWRARLKPGASVPQSAPDATAAPPGGMQAAAMAAEAPQINIPTVELQPPQLPSFPPGPDVGPMDPELSAGFGTDAAKAKAAAWMAEVAAAKAAEAAAKGVNVAAMTAEGVVTPQAVNLWDVPITAHYRWQGFEGLNIQFDTDRVSEQPGAPWQGRH